MKILKNTVILVLLALVVVLGSTLLNTRFKLGMLCREASAEFYENTGIATQLDSICVDASAIASIAKEHGLDTDSLTNAVEELQSMISHRSSAASVYERYSKVKAELSALTAKLMSQGLGDSDSQAVTALQAKIQEAQEKISSSSYNTYIQSFLEKYDRFPANLFAKLANVHLPEVFA